MTDDIHALIRRFLQQRNIKNLQENDSLPDASYNKAGVVPFVRMERGFCYCVMKPRGTVPQLGDPLFQLCKGTRQHLLESGWKDMKAVSSAVDKESLAETALREGVEELGLKLDNIEHLYDLGGFTFSSATTGKAKQMWLFAAEVASRDDFLAEAASAESTEERAWFTAAEFLIAGREDHRLILEDIESRLRRHFEA